MKFHYIYICIVFILTDCFKGDNAGARECDSQGADSDSSGGSAIVATYVN